MQHALLPDSILDGANLQHANLNSAILTNANLKNASLQNANLQNAHLQNARIRKTNLQNANLQNANLQNARIQKTHLQHTNLLGANLQNTVLAYLFEPSVVSIPYPLTMVALVVSEGVPLSNSWQNKAATQRLPFSRTSHRATYSGLGAGDAGPELESLLSGMSPDVARILLRQIEQRAIQAGTRLRF